MFALKITNAILVSFALGCVFIAEKGFAKTPTQTRACHRPSNFQQSIRLDARNGVMSFVPPTFQYGTDMCYAFASQQIFDAWRAEEIHGAVIPSSPIWAALLGTSLNINSQLPPVLSSSAPLPERGPLDTGNSVDDTLGALFHFGSCDARSMARLIPPAQLDQRIMDIGYGRTAESRPAPTPQVEAGLEGISRSPVFQRLYQAFSAVCGDRLEANSRPEIHVLNRRSISTAPAGQRDGVHQQNITTRYEVANFEDQAAQEINDQLQRGRPAAVEYCSLVAETSGITPEQIHADLFSPETGRQLRRLECGSHAVVIIGSRATANGERQFLIRDSRLDQGCQRVSFPCQVECDHGNQYWINADILLATTMIVNTLR